MHFKAKQQNDIYLVEALVKVVNIKMEREDRGDSGNHCYEFSKLSLQVQWQNQPDC